MARAEVVDATRATALLGVVSLGVSLGNLLFNVVVARSGGVSAYGGTGSLLALGTGSGFLALGVQYAVARRAATTDETPRELLGSLAKLAGPWCALALVAIAGAPVLSSFLRLSSELPVVATVMLAGIFIATAAPMGVLIGRRRFRAVALLMAMSTVLRLALAAPFGHLSDPVLGALLASVVPAAIWLLAATYMAIREPGIRAAAENVGAQSRSVAMSLVVEGVTGTGLATIVWSIWTLPLIIARHALGPDQASDLAAAQLSAGGVILVAGVAVTAFFPGIARHRSARMVLTGLLVSFLLALAGAGAMVAMLPGLTPRLYGSGFAAPVPLVLALGTSLVAVTIANYLLWVTRALQSCLLPTALGVALALTVEVGLALVWAPGATVLALEPALAVTSGVALGAATALAGSAGGRRRLVAPLVELRSVISDKAGAQ